ncbi:Fur-regulated basic protein FbpA [Sporolactobacillus pectinivorans]|uniref:Fur-regulated basic protein FbpA n=1 Tax=Sporolactobacillus pectinivorans TaxID=1591408 RepID=UPI000C265A11|nr:Fur-regulated basic protein FbpA [Sporolactobacillus pectinivorans]
MYELFDSSSEEKKEMIIGKLLDLGIYKAKNQQLYELSLRELETYYNLSKAN